MNKELLESIQKFTNAFEQVFDKDWSYTKEQLGIQGETAEQKENAIANGLETIVRISDDGTFINPNVDDEVEDWGYRGQLLSEYRHLKKLLEAIDQK